MEFVLGPTLKEMRLTNGLTIKQVASMVNLTYKNYKAIEHSTGLPGVYSLDKLANLYNVTPTFLLIGNHLYDDYAVSDLPLTIKEHFILWYYKWIYGKRADITVSFVNSYHSQAISVIEVFGNKTLDEITKNDIKSFLDTQIDKAIRTVSLQRSIIKQVFDCAADSRVYNYSNPAINVKVPKTAKQAVETKPIQEKTRMQILQFKHKLQPAAVIMLLAGLRRGELLALTYNDIHLYDGYILVNKAVVMQNGVPVLMNRTKTKNGMRKVDMPQVLISFLINFLGNNPQIKKSDLVLPNTHGNIMSAKSFIRCWNNYIYEMNACYGDFSDIDTKDVPINELPIRIERFTSKQLRHTYLCSLYNAGVEPVTASRLMGHASVAFTLSVYYHLDAQTKKKNIAKFDDYLNKFVII